MANLPLKTIFKRSAFASCGHVRALARYLPCQLEDHVCITTNEVLRFYNIKFYQMPCKLDCIENPRSFEKCTTPP